MSHKAMILDRLLMDHSLDLIEGGNRFLAARNDILGSVEFGLHLLVHGPGVGDHRSVPSGNRTGVIPEL